MALKQGSQASSLDNLLDWYSVKKFRTQFDRRTFRPLARANAETSFQMNVVAILCNKNGDHSEISGCCGLCRKLLLGYT